MQALALSLLLAIPLVWVQGPPRVQWIDASIFSPPPAPAAPAPANVQRAMHGSEMSGEHMLQPSAIPSTISQVVDLGPTPSAPAMSETGPPGGSDLARPGVPGGMIDGPTAVVPPPPLAPTRPLRVSHWAEGNIAYQVQPRYPRVAQAAGIQGTVQLRAIVSKTGTIENLTVIGGHSMLVAAAVEAVKQWRYRPYMLNGDPIEVETEITVNFMLGGH
jgi:periplasmic protein TonB